MYTCMRHQANKDVCVFQVSRPYLGFCPECDPKHFIEKSGQNSQNTEKNDKNIQTYI